MRVLVDTNVVMDYISNREPFASHSYKIIELCITKKITGCVAAHTIINLFYILRKELSVEERKAVLLKLCRVFSVVDIDSIKIIKALGNNNFDDVEDCLQDECAEDFNADYVITRNVKDFANSKINAIEPIDFLKNLGY